MRERARLRAKSMKRAVIIVVLLLVGAVVGFFAAAMRANREHITLVSLSPDEKRRVHLVELNAWIDRNFVIRVERCTDRSFETIFRSPDEGMPIGSERIVWSPDSRQFVLLGRHFYVRDGTPSVGGEMLYLLYDVKACRLWCNAEQQRAYPHFEIGDVEWLKAPAPMPSSKPDPKREMLK